MSDFTLSTTRHDFSIPYVDNWQAYAGLDIKHHLLLGWFCHNLKPLPAVVAHVDGVKTVFKTVSYKPVSNRLSALQLTSQGVHRRFKDLVARGLLTACESQTRGFHGYRPTDLAVMCGFLDQDSLDALDASSKF
jgi:hypothetical protein